MNSIMHRTLGRTGVSVPVLGYGAMELRGADYLGGPDLTDADSDRLLNVVLDEGITYVDTAPDYGRSEERIGRALSSRRDEFFLASKVGCAPEVEGAEPAALAPHDYHPSNIRAVLEESLRRLRTERLDLVQVHLSPSRSQMETERTVETLQELRAVGKVRFLGMSGTLPNLPDQIAMDVFDVFQIPYSALQPEHDEWISRATASGAGVVIRGGTARGTASSAKNWAVQPLSGTGASAQDRWAAARLDELVADGMSRHEFVLRFTLSHPGMTVAIVGTADAEHVRSNAGAAAKGPLDPAIYAEARRRLGLRPIEDLG